jgi:iron complex outermembrane receptor protein
MTGRESRFGKLATSISWIALGTATLTTPALAQSTDTIPAPTSSSSDGPSNAAAAEGANATPDEAINDIVVTAQRRGENLQDVPLAVTALTGETLAQKNITDVTRLQELAPGLSVGRSGSDARPNIRGINTEAIGANSDPRIAFYVDDVYQSRTSQALAAFVDLERVEVQRGPQGTLYGRNSFGGNIALFSAAPKSTFDAGASLLVGNFDRVRGEAFVNIPLSESISARIAGMGERMDGYVKNTSIGSDLGDEKQYYVRGSLRFAPSDSGLEILLRASYWEQGGNGISAFGYKSLGTPFDPSLVRGPGGTLTVGGRTLTFPSGFNGGSAFGQNSFINSRFRDGIVDVTVNGVGVDLGVPIERDPYKVNFDAVTVRDTKQSQFSGTLSYDFGPVTFRSITGYSDFFAVRSSDNDFSPAPVAIDFNKTDVQTFSQEVQLLSNDRASAFQWIVGGYYYDDKIQEIFFSDNNLAFFTTGTGPLFPGGAIGILPTGSISATRDDAYSPVQLKTKSYAAFAQGSYELTAALRVTAGVRYTTDRKNYAAGVTNGILTPKPAGVTNFAFALDQPTNFACGSTTTAQGTTQAAQGANTAATFIQCGKDTFNFTTYRGAVDYKIAERNLLYASVSSGRRSGGFNNVLIDPANPALGVIAFQPEKVLAYEIGSKNRFFDNKLQANVAAYYNDYSGLQVQRQVPAPNGLTTLSIIENSGKGRSYGVEAELLYRPTGQLTLGLTAVYLNSKFTEYETGTAANGLAAVLGCPAATNPAVSATAGRNYACEAGGFSPNGFPFLNGLSDPGRFRQVTILPNGNPVFNYIIAGEGSTGETYRANIPLSPKWTVTGTAAYDIELGAGTLTPSAQVYYNSGFDNLDLNLPIAKTKSYTKTDLRLTYVAPDDRWTLQAYVENLEDRAVLNRTAIGANRSINASYAMPRTYGIRAGLRF